MTTNISKKRKFVADGVFYAELNEVCKCTCSQAGLAPAPHCRRHRRPIPRLINLINQPTKTQLLTRELAEDGYAGVEVRVVPLRTEIIIRATRTQNVLGEKGQRIRELTTVIQKRCVRVLGLVLGSIGVLRVCMGRVGWLGFCSADCDEQGWCGECDEVPASA